MTHRTDRIVLKALTCSVRQTPDAPIAAAGFDCPQQFAKRNLAFPADDEIDSGGIRRVRLRSKAGIVTSYDKPDVWPKSTDEIDNMHRGAPLECHDRQSNDVRRHFADEPLDGFTHLALNQDQIRYGHGVPRIDISG